MYIYIFSRDLENNTAMESLIAVAERGGGYYW